MNLFCKRKLTAQLLSLAIPQAGFHAFRHFNVLIMDLLRVPLKTIQERVGHALTGSFTLDVYGGQLSGIGTLAARAVGAELERAVRESESRLHDESKAVANDGLTPIQAKRLESHISQAL